MNPPTTITIFCSSALQFLSYAGRLVETAHTDVSGVLNLRKQTTDLQPTQAVSVLS